MSRTLIFVSLFVVRLAIGGTETIAASPSVSPPNIVVILADDLGIECLTTYGGRSHDTPHIDALAAQGMRFTHCFSNPYCSPSRATLLTGRYPFRNGMKEVIFDPKRHANTFLHTDQPSFPRELQRAGYATAIAGKWQLSFLRDRDTIHEFGFDHYQCWQIISEAGSRTTRFGTPYFRQDGVVIADGIRGRYGPDLNLKFLTQFIQANARDGRPFLAYSTCLLPHYPWVPTPDSDNQTPEMPEADGKGDPKFFPDMVAYLDKQVGKLMDVLEEAGIADDTVVVFLADNGTDRGLRNRFKNGVMIPGGKGTMTDRGTRVPLIVRWPGHVAAGSVCDDLIDFSDMFPTLCELTGTPLPMEKMDGRSFVPQLFGKLANRRDWVHYQDKEERVVRDREFMLSHRGELRRVGNIWEESSLIEPGDATNEVQAARKRLQAAFAELGE
jgi:arylsulfatase A